MSSERSRLKVAIFSTIGIAIVAACTILTLKLLWELWFPPFFNVVEKREPIRFSHMRALTANITHDNYTVFYREPTEASHKQRFHEAEVPVPKDSVSVCITCHGIMPHDINVHTRAYLNKHDMHMACETCHMEASKRYAWYNIYTGELSNTIDVSKPLVLTAYKLAPVTLGQTDFLNQDLIKEAGVLLKEADSMSLNERKSRLEEFHKGRLKKPVECRTCHTGNVSDDFIHLDRVGYPQNRISQIKTNEVVGMLVDYDEFIMLFLSTQDRDPSLMNQPLNIDIEHLDDGGVVEPWMRPTVLNRDGSTMLSESFDQEEGMPDTENRP
jgi:hypothetical protein